jgi:8-oxo-dGTP diphosphatase
VALARKVARAIVLKGSEILLIKRNKYGVQMYTLPGGGVDNGESAENAAAREVFEECSVKVKITRKIYTQESNQFGYTEYFLAEYQSGEPKLHPESEEYADTMKGLNTYQPLWQPISEVKNLDIWPVSLKIRLVHDLMDGMPENIIELEQND